MSISLRLLPIEFLHYTSDGPDSCSGYSHTVLNLGYLSWELSEQINDAGTPLPDRHHVTGITAGRVEVGFHEGEPVHGRFDTDCFGKPVRWITAKDVRPFLDKQWPTHPVTAYVRAMPDQGLLVLEWQ